MEVLSFPFRLDGRGYPAKVTQGSESQNVEQVAHLLYTRKGERVAVPDFGVTDPAFSELDSAELQAAVDTFGPAHTRVAITDERVVSDSMRAYTMTISPKEAQR